jgi:hypothetical protein
MGQNINANQISLTSGTLLGRSTGGTGPAQALDVTTVKSILNISNIDNTSFATKANLSGGNSFTGTQIITGAVNSTNGSGAQAYLGLGDATTTGELYLRNNDGSAYLDLFGTAAGFLYSANANHQFQIGNATRLTVNSAGAVVTGILASSNIVTVKLASTSNFSNTSPTLNSPDRNRNRHHHY